MDIKEYIESGILEAYALGALSEAERAEVEANITRYPELAAELAAIEDAMYRATQANAVQPPFFMMEHIWDQLDNKQNASVNNVPKVENKTTPLPQPAAPRPVSLQRAAIWAAMIVSVLTNFILLSQRNKINADRETLSARVDSMSRTQEQTANIINAYKKEMDMVAHAGMQTVVMRKDGDNSMAGMIYWDKAKGETYLTLHNLPMPAQGKQYQLWVIQDGTPVSMGVISNDLVANAGMMQKIPMNITSGQAFAISIENEGGNQTPTHVYMVGATTS